MPTTKTKHLLGVKFQYCDIVKIQLLSEEGATLKSFLRLISCSGLFSEARLLHKTISQTFTLLSADGSELLQAMTTALAPIPKLYLQSAALAHQTALALNVFAAGPRREQVSLDCSSMQLVSIETNAWKG